MSLMRWNPARELATWPSDIFTMQREINTMFENFFRGGTQADEATSFSLWAPAVDIAESDDLYHVNIELPGVKKEDVLITLESNILTIKGEKNQESQEKQKDYHRVERSYGAFQRSFSLPTVAKADKIDAVYNNGILSISIPKAEEAKPKQIEIKVR